MIGGCRDEVPSMDEVCGVGHPQGCVLPVHQRLVALRPLGHFAKRPHCGRPHLKVSVIAGDNKLGMAGARWHFLYDGGLRLCFLGVHVLKVYLDVLRIGPEGLCYYFTWNCSDWVANNT